MTPDDPRTSRLTFAGVALTVLTRYALPQRDPPRFIDQILHAAASTSPSHPADQTNRSKTRVQPA
jgi:hypothetical protein